MNGSKIEFQLNATANPNNMTPATQAIAARVRVTPRSHIRAQLNGQTIEVTAKRLLKVPNPGISVLSTAQLIVSIRYHANGSGNGMGWSSCRRSVQGTTFMYECGRRTGSGPGQAQSSVASQNRRTSSGKVDPVHHRQCVAKEDES